MRPLAVIILALALLAPARAAAQPPRIDEPPVFVMDFPPGTDVTVRVSWLEHSNATDRWLLTERRGQVAYFGPGEQDAAYIVLLDFDEWRPTETLTLCRRWAGSSPLEHDDIVSCHVRTPWPRYSVFVPAL